VRVSPFAITLCRLVVETVNANAATASAPNERQAFQSRGAAGETFFGKYEPIPGCFEAGPSGRDQAGITQSCRVRLMVR
jgi:hypothetical protein